MVKNFSLFLYRSQLRRLPLQTLVIFCSASPFYYAAASLQHLQRPSILIHLRCRVSSPGPYFLCCSLALVFLHGTFFLLTVFFSFEPAVLHPLHSCACDVDHIVQLIYVIRGISHRYHPRTPSYANFDCCQVHPHLLYCPGCSCIV